MEETSQILHVGGELIQAGAVGAGSEGMQMCSSETEAAGISKEQEDSGEMLKWDG